MNNLIQVNRDLREIGDRNLRAKEYQIKKIQQSYGYDRQNAEKLYDYMQVKQVEILWGSAFGGVAAYKAGPLQKELQHSFGIFRKSWMRFPLQLGAFSFFYYFGTQVPPRFLAKFSGNYKGVSDEYYQSKADLVGRFRLFDNQESIKNPNLEDYIMDQLVMYSSDPLTKPELVDHLMKKVANQVDLSKIFRIRRVGKDLDPYFWSFGKIHGLENIAFADTDELRATGGNPVSIQEIINNTPAPRGEFHNVDQVNGKFNDAIHAFRNEVDKMNFVTSDKKKILALPFYLAKRSQKPEPRRGQNEFEIFEELTRQGYYDDADLSEDPEHKITPFDYEKYFNPELLKSVDTDSDSFKELIKIANLAQRTKVENLHADREDFKNVMPFLAQLTKDEQRALIHYIENKSRSEQRAGEESAPALLDNVTSDRVNKRLAEISEEENYNKKNRYRFQKKTMDYAEKSRMPIDERTVKDLLRNQHIFRHKIDQEIGNYTSLIENPQMEHGILTYLNESAYGDMRALITDIGIKDESIPFMNYQQLKKTREGSLHETDNQFTYLLNALFTPLDMTDYEDQFVGFNEVGGNVPINRQSWLTPLQEELHPQTDNLVAIEDIEKKPVQGTSSIMFGNSEARNADPEDPEEYTGYGAEADDDEDYGDEDYDEEGGDDAEEAEEEYGEYGDYGEEEEEWNPVERLASIEPQDRFFLNDPKIRNNYNEVELGQFMKILNIKPHRQWQDQSTHHYKLGVHEYEDDSQQLDPDFHVLSEVERKHAEKITTKEWRKGSEIKFQVGEKKPIHVHKRF